MGIHIPEKNIPACGKLSVACGKLSVDCGKPVENLWKVSGKEINDKNI
jgi:hypothetical protein